MKRNYYVNIVRKADKESSNKLTLAEQELARQIKREEKALEILTKSLSQPDLRTRLSIDTNVFHHVLQGVNTGFFHDLEAKLKSKYKILVPCVVLTELDRHAKSPVFELATRAKTMRKIFKQNAGNDFWEHQPDSIYSDYFFRNFGGLSKDQAYDMFQVW